MSSDCTPIIVTFTSSHHSFFCFFLLLSALSNFIIKAGCLVKTELICSHPYPQPQVCAEPCYHYINSDNSLQLVSPTLSFTKAPWACVQTMRLAAAELWCSPASTWGSCTQNVSCVMINFSKFRSNKKLFWCNFFFLFWSNIIMSETIQLNTHMGKATVSI